MNNISFIVEHDLCVGCLDCLTKCPKKAISVNNDEGYAKPIIDNSKCIDCSLCTNVCPILFGGTKKQNDRPLGQFIGFCNDEQLTKGSSSGGIATAIAKKIIDMDGVVYGASLLNIDEHISLRHICINNKNELYKIQGSKYIQSTIKDVLMSCATNIKNNKNVVFFGTSCQIAALNSYLGGNNYQNLLLVDFVCHGVPKDSLFNNYISFLEKKYRGKIVDVTFRKKSIRNETINNYVFSVSLFSKNRITKKNIPLKDSSFYRMFMHKAEYRPSCYNCRYANVSKPSDITLGDFYNYNNHSLSRKNNLSVILANTQKGLDFISKLENIESEPVPLDDVLKTHDNLKQPSIVTNEGKKMHSLYLSGGFKKLQRYIDCRNFILLIPSLIKKLFKKR